MISKWFENKDKIIQLRKQGYSYNYIEKQFGTPRSTLSGWLSGIELKPKQLSKLQEGRWLGLQKAREKAVTAHNKAKEKRLATALFEAKQVIGKINNSLNLEVLELVLAMLYWGEGFKKTEETGIGNSDPKLLIFFLACIEQIYGFDCSKIRPELHLRADQDPNEIKKYWSKELNIPLKNFNTVSIDQRTVGKKTYIGYKGVCVIRIGSVAIQRRILYIINLFSEQIINKRA